MRFAASGCTRPNISSGLAAQGHLRYRFWRLNRGLSLSLGLMMMNDEHGPLSVSGFWVWGWGKVTRLVILVSLVGTIGYLQSSLS